MLPRKVVLNWFLLFHLFHASCLAAADDVSSKNMSRSDEPIFVGEFYLQEFESWVLKCPSNGLVKERSNVTWFRGSKLIHRSLSLHGLQFWCFLPAAEVESSTGDLALHHVTSELVEENFTCVAEERSWTYKLVVYNVTGQCAVSKLRIIVVIAPFALFLIVLVIFLWLTCRPVPETMLIEAKKIPHLFSADEVLSELSVLKMTMPMHRHDPGHQMSAAYSVVLHSARPMALTHLPHPEATHLPRIVVLQSLGSSSEQDLNLPQSSNVQFVSRVVLRGPLSVYIFAEPDEANSRASSASLGISLNHYASSI